MTKRKVTEPDGTVEEIEVPDDPTPVPEAPVVPEVSPEQEALDAASKDLAEKKQAVLDATAVQMEAQAQFDALAIEASKPDPKTEVLISGAKVKFPTDSALDSEGRCRERVIRIGGRNHEHVSTTDDGVWEYRYMPG